MDASEKKQVQDEIIDEWAGAWVLNPKTDKDRIASRLAKESIKFTKAESFISPVAVAAIDILGIKDLLGRMPLEEVTERFVEPFYDLNGPAYHSGNVNFSREELEEQGFIRMASAYHVTISDTILIIRRPDWELGNKDLAEAHAVVALADYVCQVIKVNSLYGIPLRAAIAFGECLVSVGESRALLGLATGEASAWERQQE
jgi:hypothetical protein